MANFKRSTQRERALKFEDFSKFLQSHYDQCPWCSIYDPESSIHPLFRCTNSGSVPTRQKYLLYRDSLRASRSFQGLSTCTFCFLPPYICQRWIPKSDDIGWRRSRKDECTYPDISLSIFATALTLSDFIDKYTSQLGEKGVQYSHIESEVRYLSRTIQWANMDVSRLLLVVVEAQRSIQETIDNRL